MSNAITRAAAREKRKRKRREVAEVSSLLAESDGDDDGKEEGERGSGSSGADDYFITLINENTVICCLPVDTNGKASPATSARFSLRVEKGDDGEPTAVVVTSTRQSDTRAESIEDEREDRARRLWLGLDEGEQQFNEALRSLRELVRTEEAKDPDRYEQCMRDLQIAVGITQRRVMAAKKLQNDGFEVQFDIFTVTHSARLPLGEVVEVESRAFMGHLSDAGFKFADHHTIIAYFHRRPTVARTKKTKMTTKKEVVVPFVVDLDTFPLHMRGLFTGYNETYCDDDGDSERRRYTLSRRRIGAERSRHSSAAGAGGLDSDDDTDIVVPRTPDR